MMVNRGFVKRIGVFLRTGIWQVKKPDVHPVAFFFLEVFKKLFLSVRFFTASRVMNEAAALTYSTMLAIVPILAVVFAIARGFGYNRYIEVWFRDAFKSQPQVADVIVGFVNSYLVHTKSGVFLGFGLVFMLYTVLMLVSNIEKAFNGIWQVKKPRSIFRTFTDYLAMFFLLPIIIVLTSGFSIVMATVTSGIFTTVLPYVLMAAMFIALYVFMPNTHVRVKNCIVPGILAGTAMQWLQLFYIHSQMWVSSYNAIYGSFAALPMFMLWVQISWTICLFGAELCYTNQNLDYYDYNATTSDISHRYRMMMCAVLMRVVCRRFDKGLPAMSAMELRDETGIPIRIVNDLIYTLIAARLLTELSTDEKGEASRFQPAESTEHLSVGLMIDRLEATGRWRFSLPLDQLQGGRWREVTAARSAYLCQLRGVLLKDL